MESIISVSVLVFQSENILFIKSNSEKDGLKLVLPGGKLKDNENIEECAIREVREVAGLQIILEKKLSGIITRRNKQGNFLVTFIFLAEAIDNIHTNNTVYIPYKDIKHYREISGFSKLIIDKLNVSSLSGMDRETLRGTDGRDYLMYF